MSTHKPCSLSTGYPILQWLLCTSQSVPWCSFRRCYLLLLFGATKGFVSLMFSYFVGMKSTSIIRVNMLSKGVKGVPFYALSDLFRCHCFHCHPGWIRWSCPQLILGCSYSPFLQFKHMHKCIWNFPFHILWHYSMFLPAALHLWACQTCCCFNS